MLLRIKKSNATLIGSSFGLGGTGSGAGAWIIGVKVTNDQPMVFTSEANRDAYFSANPDELDRISGSSNIVGIGTVAEDTSSVPADGWYAYGYENVATWRQTVEIATGPRGEKGEAGSTPSVIVEQVPAPNHGFVAQDVLDGTGVRRDATDPRNWVAASSSDIDTCASSLLAEIIDANNLLIILEGTANQPSHGFNIGDIYYLGTNGRATNTLPTTGRVQQLFTVIDADNVLINIGQSHRIEPSDKSFQAIIDSFNHVSGTRLSEAQANELVVDTLGINAFWRTTAGRIMPQASRSNNSWFVWNNNAADETTANANVSELILPAESVRGKALVARIARTSSGGTREFRVYDGDPSTGAQEIFPLYGNGNAIQNNQHEVVFDIERPDGVANDIHIVPKIQGVFNLELTSRLPYTVSHIESSNFKEACASIFVDSQIGNGGPLNTLANNMMSVLGAGGEFRTTAGRVYPVAFGNGAGFFSNAAGDETAASANVCEYVFPAGRLQHNQVIEVRFGQVSTGGTQRDIRIHAGDPTTTGVKIEPILGTEAHGATDVTYWRVSTTPDAGGIINYDLHIVFSFCVVQDIALHTDLPLDVSTSGTGMFRGGVASLNNSTTIDIAAGDGVIVSTTGARNIATPVRFNAISFNPSLTTDGNFVITMGTNAVPVAAPILSYTEITRRDSLTLGAFEVSGGAIVSVTPIEVSANEPLQQFFDFVTSWGTVVRRGLNVTANGANMQIDYSGGELHFLGAGAQVPGNRQPNVLPITGGVVRPFTTYLGRTGTQVATGTTVIDPSTFDDGTTTPAAIGGAPGRATVWRFYQLPVPSAELVALQGQTVYDSLDDAIAADDDADFVLPSPFGAAVLRERIAMTQNCTSLQDGSTARFLKAPKSGTEPAAGSGAPAGGTDSPLEIVAKLESITVQDDKLSPDAIKSPTIAKSVTLNGTDQWIDLIEWADFTAGDGRGIGANCLLSCDDASGNSIFGSKIEGYADRSSDLGAISITTRVGDYPIPGTLGKYRWYKESDTEDSKIWLQFQSGLSGTYTFYIADIARVYDQNVTVGTLVVNASTTGKVIGEEITVTNWQEQEVTAHFKGISTKFVGAEDAGSYDTYGDNSKITHVNGVPIIRATSTGMRISAGQYGSWTAPTSTDWPIDATFFTTLIAEKRPDVVPPLLPDTSKNPSSTVTLTGIDSGGVTAATMTGFDPAHRGLRFGTAGGGGLALTFANCLFQRVQFTMSFGTATSSGGTTQDYEIVDENGIQVFSFDIPAGNNEPGDINTFVFEFTSGRGDAQYTLRKRSTGTSQTVYLFNYGMTVLVDEPALEPNVIAQYDSPLFGILWSRIIIDNTIAHPQGATALDGLSGNRPVLFRGNAFNYFVTNRFSISSIQYAALLLPNSSPAAQNWTGGGFVTQEKFQGFDVLRFPNSTVSPGVGNISMVAPFFNTLAAWQEAFNIGFRMDWRGLLPVAGSFHGWNFEPFAGSGFPTGQRAVVNVQDGSAAGLFDIKDENSGIVVSDIDGTVMNNISIRFPAGGGNGEVILNGQPILTVTWGGANPARGLFIFDNGSATREIYYQSLSMYVISSDQIDKTYTDDEIDNSIVEVIPSVANDLIRRVPKGLRSPGDNFTIDSGSSGTVTVQGQDDDIQLFGGATSFVVPPNTKVTFTNSGWPEGINWLTSVISGDVGNSFKATIESDGTIIGERHKSSTYKGAVTIGNPQTGQFSFTIPGVTFDDSTVVHPTAYSLTGAKLTCTHGISLGEVFVDITDASGSRVDDRFSVTIEWN